jgi:fructokinase
MRIGFDIGGTKIAACGIGENGTILGQSRCRAPRGDYPGTLEALRGLMEEVENQAGARSRCAGIGVPGNVDRGRGSLRLGNAWWLADKPFRDEAAKALGIPVRLANDADCFTLSEAVDGAGAGCHSVFGVILGTGVGGGFAMDGRLVTGCLGIAGEWGHIPMPRGTPEELTRGPCSCGRHGCVETLLSGPSLARDFTLSTGRTGTSAHELTALAASGDTQAEATLAAYEERLGRALAVLVNILEPDVIVLGGGVSNIERLFKNVPALILPHVFGGRCETRMLRNKHGDSSGMRGAARLFTAEECSS